MPRTIGFHLVKSCYGQWLPGDQRGHWSSAWDDQIGYIEPHMLHEGDPVRLRMAQERMKHSPVLLDDAMTDAVAGALGDCIKRSHGGLSISAVAIHVTHMHLLLPYSAHDIDDTVKWIADQTTKSVHRHTCIRVRCGQKASGGCSSLTWTIGATPCDTSSSTT